MCIARKYNVVDVLGVELAGGLLRSLRVVMVISHRRSCMASSIITTKLGSND